MDRIAASGNSSDVQAALDLAQTGDTVIIPAGGPWTWTTGVSRTSIPANVTLRGQGTTATGGGDQTIIIDSVSGNNPLLSLGIASTGTFRLTGITFQSGTLNTIKDNGTVIISGPGSIRIDHVTFDMDANENYKYLLIQSSVFGVIDSSILNNYGTNTVFVLNGRTDVGDHMANTEWSLPTALGGPDFFFIEDNIINGTTNFHTYDSRVVDSWTGGRVVVRFNTISQATVLETHATGHSSDDRGTRAQEAYCNLITSSLVLSPNFVMADVSNGTGVVWGNDASNGGNNVYKNMFKLAVTRANNGTYPQSATPDGWGYAGPSPYATIVVNITGTTMTRVSGDNFDLSWPANSAIIVPSAVTTKSVSSITRASTTATVTCNAHGWSNGATVQILGCDGIDRDFYNGIFTITTVDSNTFTYTMSGTPSGSATGTISARVGLQYAADYAPSITGAISSVNSTSSITLAQGGYSAGTLTGVTVKIGSAWDGNTNAYGYPAIDQPGRGQGQLLTGSFPNKLNSVTGTIAWPNQALEPIYIWNNIGTYINGWNGTYYSADSNRVAANRDYYPQASGVQTNATTPFDGTSGTGWGTLVNRPTTCAAGVAYWATDEGDWNQSTSNPYGVQQNGADGVLYVATATNTWTLYYEPYTYPHPLRNETPNAPAKQRLKKVIQSGILMNRRRR